MSGVRHDDGRTPLLLRRGVRKNARLVAARTGIAADEEVDGSRGVVAPDGGRSVERPDDAPAGPQLATTITDAVPSALAAGGTVAHTGWHGPRRAGEEEGLSWLPSSCAPGSWHSQAESARDPPRTGTVART